MGPCRSLAKASTLPRTLHLCLFFLAFSFVLILPSGFLGMIQARLVNARPAPPHPLHLSLLSSGWLGGIQARLINARPNTPSPPGEKAEEKEKRKGKRQGQMAEKEKAKRSGQAHLALQHCSHSKKTACVELCLE